MFAFNSFFFTALWTDFTVGLIQRNVGHMVIMIIQLAWSQNNSCYCFLFWGFQTFYTITEQASIFVVVAPFCWLIKFIRERTWELGSSFWCFSCIQKNSFFFSSLHGRFITTQLTGDIWMGDTVVTVQ